MTVGAGAVERLCGAEVRQREIQSEREKEIMCANRSTIRYI